MNHIWKKLPKVAQAVVKLSHRQTYSRVCSKCKMKKTLFQMKIKVNISITARISNVRFYSLNVSIILIFVLFQLHLYLPVGKLIFLALNPNIVLWVSTFIVSFDAGNVKFGKKIIA